KFYPRFRLSNSGRAPSPLFFAARGTPSSPSSPPRKRGGRRADRRNLPLVYAPIGGRVAPFGAPSRRSHRGAGSALSALRLSAAVVPKLAAPCGSPLLPGPGQTAAVRRQPAP